MTVRPLRDGRYVVETEGGTYVVDADAASCTCPDSAIRGARCKHVHRVLLEIESGEVPPPGERAAACAVCGERVFVPMTADGPHLCPRHALAPGDAVRDRETGKLLLVVADTGERADEATTEECKTIAEYETNANYGVHEPVFEAVYLDSFEAGRDLDAVVARLGPSAGGTRPFEAGEKRYGFPASRLQRVQQVGERSPRRVGRKPTRDDQETTKQQTLSESASAAV